VRTIATAASASGTISASSTEAALGSAASGSSISTATTATETATSATLRGFDEALVNLEDLLLLTLTFTLGLSAGPSNEVFFLVLDNRLGICPLLVLLAALIWLAGLGDTGTKLELLLSELSKVISVGDAVILWLGRLAIGAFSQSFLLFGLGDGLASLLVGQFSVTFGRAPGVASLLLGITVLVRKKFFLILTWIVVSPANSTAMSVKLTTSSTALIGSAGSSLLRTIISWLSSVVCAASVAVTES
jgi:hypothetical protein